MGFSKAAGTVLLVGIGLVIIGLLIQVYKGGFVNRVKDMFWIENTPWLQLMNVGYNVVPIIIIIMGVICIVIAGKGVQSREVY